MIPVKKKKKKPQLGLSTDNRGYNRLRTLSTDWKKIVVVGLRHICRFVIRNLGRR